MKRLLDVFQGLGGWSDGFSDEGWDILGVEIVNLPCRHHRIIADMNCSPLRADKLNQYFDAIVGSPPCKHFSKIAYVSKIHNWKEQPNPTHGLKLVNAFFKLIEQARPTFWIMENVPGLRKHLEFRPSCTVKLTRTMIRCLWGRFPPFLIPMELGLPEKQIIGGKLRSWLRAYLPQSFTRAAAQAML